jgi:hypothetical protein
MAEFLNTLLVDDSFAELHFARDMQPLGVALTSKVASLLSKAISGSKGLQKLDLSGSATKDRGTVKVAEALASNPSVLHLSLSFCRISNVGATALASALRTNSRLLSLNLNGNQVEDMGCARLAESLKQNQILGQLELGFNRISNSGATRLAHALQHNRSLWLLGLESNEVDDWGMQILADAIPKGVLGELRVHGNPASQEAQLKVANVVKRNKRLLMKSRICPVSPRHEFQGVEECPFDEKSVATLELGAQMAHAQAVVKVSAKETSDGQKTVRSILCGPSVGVTPESPREAARVPVRILASGAEKKRIVVKDAPKSVLKKTTKKSVPPAATGKSFPEEQVTTAQHRQSKARVPANTVNRASARYSANAIELLKGKALSSASCKPHNTLRLQPMEQNTFTKPQAASASHAMKNISHVADDRVEEKSQGSTSVGSICSTEEDGESSQDISMKPQTDNVDLNYASDTDSSASMEKRHQEDNIALETIQKRRQGQSHSKTKREKLPYLEAKERFLKSAEASLALEDDEQLSVNPATMREIFSSTWEVYKHRIEFKGGDSLIQDFGNITVEARARSSVNESDYFRDMPMAGDASWKKFIDFNPWLSCVGDVDPKVRVIPSRVSRSIHLARSLICGSKATFSVDQRSTQVISSKSKLEKGGEEKNSRESFCV